MKVNIKRIRQQQTIDTVNEQESEAIQYCLALACEFCRELRGFGRQRLDDMVRGMYSVCAENYTKYREDENDEEFGVEDIPFLYTGLRNQATSLGVDTEGIERRCAIDPHYGGWKTGHAREKRSWRATLLDNREKLYRSMWYALMIYLWRTYGWGKDRLTRLYTFVRTNYKVTFQEYLVGTAEKDQWVQTRERELVDKYKKLGVKF